MQNTLKNHRPKNPKEKRRVLPSPNPNPGIAAAVVRLANGLLQDTQTCCLRNAPFPSLRNPPKPQEETYTHTHTFTLCSAYIRIHTKGISSFGLRIHTKVRAVYNTRPQKTKNTRARTHRERQDLGHIWRYAQQTTHHGHTPHTGAPTCTPPPSLAPGSSVMLRASERTDPSTVTHGWLIAAGRRIR